MAVTQTHQTTDRPQKTPLTIPGTVMSTDHRPSWISDRNRGRRRPILEPGIAMRSAGRQLDGNVRTFMQDRLGFGFGDVRVHTDEPARTLSRSVRAKAFTSGSHVFFGSGQYDPGSGRGLRLLAHELTHVMQQAGAQGRTPPDSLLQRTDVEDVLGEFESPQSTEKLWVMPEDDPYTRIVRSWQPVKAAVNEAEKNLNINKDVWRTKHRTDPTWSPEKSFPSQNPLPNAFVVHKPSPVGTDPLTCATARLLRAVSKQQARIEHTCAIGSFRIFVTVDSIDSRLGWAGLRVWMFNVMSLQSAKKFAPLFPKTAKPQHMYWTWGEEHSWQPPPGLPGKDLTWKPLP